MNDRQGARYSRILVKLSGEALMGAGDYGVDPAVLKRIAGEINDIAQMGVQVAVVIGGGNIFRGAGLARAGMDRVTGDHMGMLATVMNALAMQDALGELRALRAGDVGHPHQSGVRGLHPAARGAPPGKRPRRDLCGRHRQSVLHHRHRSVAARHRDRMPNCCSKATKVNGVYSDDPVTQSRRRALLAPHLRQGAQDKLNVMDATAIVMCRDNRLPLRVFNLNNPGDLTRIVRGEDVGTAVTVD